MAKAIRRKSPKVYKSKYFVINVKIRQVDTTDDLSTKEYARIFRDFYLAGVTAHSSVQKECVLITQGEHSYKNEKAFVGQFAQVTNVNNRKWFDKTKKELDKSFKIPEKYAANAAITEYTFIPSIHRFAYRISSANFIPAYSTRTYLQTALSRFLSTGYVVDVDVESDNAAIQRIWEAPEIIRLEININYSNNDFTKALQRFVENDMKASNVGSLHIEAVQKGDQSIKIDKSEILGGALATAASNGDATATIRDANGKRLTIRTENNPEKISIEATEDNRIGTLFNGLKNEYRQQ